MQIKFQLKYKTKFREVIKISGNISELGNNDADFAVEMFPVNGEIGEWDCYINIPESTKLSSFSYKYIIEDLDTGNRYFEWGENRVIDFENFASKNIFLIDSWRSYYEPHNVFYYSAFSKVLFQRTSKRKVPAKKNNEDAYNIVFNLANIRINKNHSVAILGNIKELSNWDKSKPILLNENKYPQWSCQITVKTIKHPIIYRYCIVDTKTKEIITEENVDRILETNKSQKSNIIIRSDEAFSFQQKYWKGTGVAIPVFSLRSKKGHGVGEFLDLKLLVDWAKRTGIKLIQILPINDTVATHTWVDSYPYAAISVFALHPIYLNLNAIGNLSTKITQEIIEEQKAILSQKEKVDYEAVMKIKSRFYKLIFDEQKNDFYKDENFLKFFKENKHWLEPYAAFSYLRDLFGTPDFNQWGRFSKVENNIIEELTSSSASHYDDIAVHYFIQYHLHNQLLEAAEYARKNKVVLKGDIPIGIFKHSVDAWISPELYNMNAQAGAPPDDFSELGQNWRFPTYNWEEMAKDNYLWWQNRMKKMADYFDAFRIDHILGFFRIWEIPENQVQGLMGYFNPSIPIYRNEFDEKGIDFDFYRFCTPFIRDYMLPEIFGNHAEYVKNNFLVEYEYGKFYIKPEYDDQKKVEAFIGISEADSSEDRQKKQQIMNGLYKLLSEVIFLKYPHLDQETYIPRHSLYKTYSFRELGHNVQQKIMELYNHYYFHRNEEYWKQQAYIKLPAIKDATDMLICGEDLGMIPKSVPQVMNDLNILSLEIQRMPKDEKIEFEHPNNYPYMSVATPSSHDTSTIRGWWEEDPSRSQRFYNQILGKQGGSPFYCEPWLVKDIIIQHIYSPSMWVVFPLQDLLGIDENLRHWNAQDERINIPANPRHYWRYRMHIPLEDLLKQDLFNDELKKLFTESGRVNSY
ncbi:MAG: 4-alpha-glucanotransferase [Bacteroidales bacterium]|nr:4-alpha-glucanotransferase [Bacteroidales bacterium]